MSSTNLKSNNEVPITHLAASGALPIRIVNGNSFDVTGVSEDNVSAHNPGQLHKEVEVSISQTTMLCDPDLHSIP